MADVFVSFSTYLLGITGIAANFILIVMITQCTPAYLAGYSQLLLASAVCDSIGLLALMGTSAKEVVFDWSCVVEHYGPCTTYGPKACVLLFGMQCEMYSTSVMMMCFSFYYRYCSLQQQSEMWLRKLRLISIPAIVLSNIPLAFLFYRSMLMGLERTSQIHAYRENHLSAPDVLGVIHINAFDGLFLLLNTSLSSVVPFILSIFIRHITLRKSCDLQANMSLSSQQLHKILVRVLNWQLVLVAGFFVGSVFLLIDFMELPWLRNTSILAIPLCNLQNVCPPIANLFIVTPYRKKIATCFTVRKANSSSAVAGLSAFTHSTTQNQLVSTQ